MIRTTLAPGYGWPQQAKPVPVMPEPVFDRKGAVLKHLAEHPGASVREVCNGINVPDGGSIRMLLHGLCQRKRITRVSEGGVWRHYILNDAELPPIELQKQIILYHLNLHPGMMMSKLADKCGRNVTGTQSLLNSLIKSGHVKRSWSSERWFYEVAV